MKKYQKAELIAKNLPTGSYAAGCPSYKHAGCSGSCVNADGYLILGGCEACEVAS